MLRAEISAPQGFTFQFFQSEDTTRKRATNSFEALFHYSWLSHNTRMPATVRCNLVSATDGQANDARIVHETGVVVKINSTLDIFLVGNITTKKGNLP